MNRLESLHTESRGSTTDSLGDLLGFSLRDRKRKNKGCGVVAIICIAGVTIGFGFLFIQNSEFVEEKVHYADPSHQNQPVAQAQQQSIVYDLPMPNPSNRVTTSSPSTTTVSSANATTTANKTLSGDAQSRHAVSLLYEMRLNPPPAFEYKICPIHTPRSYFKTTLLVAGTGKEYIGYGNKKRLSKKLAAQQACAEMFHLSYPENPDLAAEKEKCGL